MAELGAYWWEGRWPVAAWFLTTTLAGLLGWDWVAGVAMSSTTGSEAGVDGPVAGAGLCLGYGDFLVPNREGDHSEAGPGGVHRLDIGQDLALLEVPRNLLLQVAQAVVDVNFELVQDGTVLGKDILKVGVDAVAKDDGEETLIMMRSDIFSFFSEQSAITASKNSHSLAVLCLVNQVALLQLQALLQHLGGASH